MGRWLVSVRTFITSMFSIVANLSSAIVDYWENESTYSLETLQMVFEMHCQVSQQ